jgi:ribonuclease R
LICAGSPFFTIDGADTKDIDDAISLRCTESGWELGVHIAECELLCAPRLALDTEAFERGTSVYYADRVIPMLAAGALERHLLAQPAGGQARLFLPDAADPRGRNEQLSLVKSVIRSRIKGVYSEINAIYDGSAGEKFTPNIKRWRKPFGHAQAGRAAGEAAQRARRD